MFIIRQINIPGWYHSTLGYDKGPHKPTITQIKEKIEILETYPDAQDWSHKARAQVLRWVLGEIELFDDWFE